ncbi:hypothetical protein TK49_04020 [Ralstonia mannitolilytica]|nr:hypothetical protein TK49_04020 [Ralstonia mannitolilytica]
MATALAATADAEQRSPRQRANRLADTAPEPYCWHVRRQPGRSDAPPRFPDQRLGRERAPRTCPAHPPSAEPPRRRPGRVGTARI